MRSLLADFLATVLPQDLQQLLDLDRLHKETSLAARQIKSRCLDNWGCGSAGPVGPALRGGRPIGSSGRVA